jgi:pyruvate formate lyase activating enzyme
MKEALFYEKQNGGFVVCGLCSHSCRIATGETGLCGARRNIGGALFAESYGCVSSLGIDPIEKKPLKRFYPGSLILSVGCYGCNMRCAYCQNYAISQQKPETREAQPEELLRMAKNTAGNIGIAFTYNEPLVGIEYILDAAPLFKNAELKVVLVTNGMINAVALETLLPYVDAMNIDVKAFDADRYKKLGGDFSAVMKTVEKSAAVCHVEVTSLIVPGRNDGLDDMRGLAQWLAGISPEIPLHITRFFPRYRMTDGRPTPIETMKSLAESARNVLKYVFLGNV